MRKSFVLIFLLGCAGRPIREARPIPMVVRVPVANVRAEPVDPLPGYAYDPLQETQVIRGETVNVLERKGAWARVQCPEQMEFTHSQMWEGYPGWIRFNRLAKTSNPPAVVQRLLLPEQELRERILAAAEKHLGSRYLWGGRSLHDPALPLDTGVDCSGLVNWSYRQVDWLVPRDAHEQYMKAKAVVPSKIKKGDLIFLAQSDRPDKIVHVMMYAGEETVIEAPQTGERVRKISIIDRLGVSLSELEGGQVISDYTVRFGTFFEEGL